MEEQAEAESDELKQVNSGLLKPDDGLMVDHTKNAMADESGIGSELSDSLMDHTKADLDVSCATNHTSLNGSKLDLDVSHTINHDAAEGAKFDFNVSASNNHTSVEELITPDKNKSENSFSVSVMKKDDSGIYSEKSPNGGSITKENSDASLSESISESLDENLLLSNTPMEIDGSEVDINVTDNTESQVANNSVIAMTKVHEGAIEEDKLNAEAKVLDETMTNDAVTVGDKIANDSADNSVILDDKNKLGNVMDDDAMNNASKHLHDTNNKDVIAADVAVDQDMVDKSDKSSTFEGHSESELLHKQNESENLKESIEEQGASTSDKTDTVDSEGIIDKTKDENKSECDNADEAATSEQVDKSQTEGHKPGEKRRTRRYVFHDGSSSSSSNTVSDDEVHAIHRRRRRNRLLDSDSDIDSDDDIGGDKKSSSESEDGVEESVPLTQYGAPKQKWRAMYDVRERELGYSSKKYENYFQQKVQGSLQMVQRFELQYKMDHHEGCVNALHFNRIGTLLASGSDDLNIVIWNWIQNRPALIYDSGHRSNVFQAKFMPFSGDCHVVSCARDGQVRLADLSSTGVCKGTKKLAQHRGAAHKLALEFDSPHLFLSCGEDAVTYEIDLREEKPNKLVTTKEKGKKVAMYSIHTNPCNSFEFCVGGRDHYVRVYDKRKIVEEEDDNNGVLKKFCPDHLVDNEAKANVTCACYNWNGTEVLGSYNDEDIYLFSNEHSDGSNYIHKYIGHRNNQTVKGVNFYGPHSEFVVSGSDCGHIFLWDKDTENIVQYMDGDDGGVINVLEPHPYAPVLATSGLDHDVKIWAPTAEKPTTLKGLSKVMKRNSRQREEEKENGGGMLDGQMLWFIMHQLRRGRRRREREENADPDGELSSDSSVEEDSDPGSDDPESRLREGISCNPS